MRLVPLKVVDQLYLQLCVVIFEAWQYVKYVTFWLAVGGFQNHVGDLVGSTEVILFLLVPSLYLGSGCQKEVGPHPARRRGVGRERRKEERGTRTRS